MFASTSVDAYFFRDYARGEWYVLVSSEKFSVARRAVIDDFGNLVPVGRWI
jgi:hypothetical protein